jgi:hypothetical protein
MDEAAHPISQLFVGKTNRIVSATIASEATYTTGVRRTTRLVGVACWDDERILAAVEQLRQLRGRGAVGREPPVVPPAPDVIRENLDGTSALELAVCALASALSKMPDREFAERVGELLGRIPALLGRRGLTVDEPAPDGGLPASQAAVWATPRWEVRPGFPNPGDLTFNVGLALRIPTEDEPTQLRAKSDDEKNLVTAKLLSDLRAAVRLAWYPDGPPPSSLDLEIHWLSHLIRICQASAIGDEDQAWIVLRQRVGDLVESFVKGAASVERCAPPKPPRVKLAAEDDDEDGNQVVFRLAVSLPIAGLGNCSLSAAVRVNPKQDFEPLRQAFLKYSSGEQ